MSGQTPRRITRAASRATTPAATGQSSTSDNVASAVSTAHIQTTTTPTPRASGRGRWSAASVRQTTSHDANAQIQAEAAASSPAFDPSRPDTSLGIDAGYTGPSRNTGLMLPPPRPYGPMNRPDVTAPEVNTPKTVTSPGIKASTPATGKKIRPKSPEPSGTQVLLSTFTHYFPELAHEANPTIQQLLMKWFSWSVIMMLLFLASTGILISMGFTYSVIPLPNALQPFRQSWVTGQKHAFGFSTQTDVLEQLDATSAKLDVASTELSRLHEIRNMFEESRDQVRLQDEALSELRRYLPDVIVVEKQNDEIILTERFWAAFEQKINDTSDTSPLWDALLRAHSKAIEEKISSEFFENVVTKDEYLQVIRNAVNIRIDNDIERFEQKIAEIAKTITEQTTQEYINKYSHTFTYEDRQALKQFRRAQSGYNANINVNYFEPALGAMVNPHRTSSTMAKTKPLKSNKSNYKGLVLLQQRPAVEALTHVFDASSCWCAAPSTDKGKAQIGIKTAVSIHPDTLIIEHIPAAATLDISTAPRTFEVWAELDSAAAVRAAHARIIARQGHANRGSCGPAPSKNAICLYKGEYNIHHYDHVQQFPMWYHTSSLGIATDFITVRASENWGGAWTCIYRLRMHGHRAVVEGS